MGRHLANCGRTVDGGSDGIVTTPCDCACEGCCCQYLTFSAHAGDLWVDFTWAAPSTDGLLACVGLLDSYIDHVDVFFDYCPPLPDDGGVPADYVFTLSITPSVHAHHIFGPPPIKILGASDHTCVTMIFYDGNGNERTRCTAKVTR